MRGYLVEGRAEGLVVEKYFLHAQGHALVEEEDVGLEIVLKATEVNVCASARADAVVADEKL